MYKVLKENKDNYQTLRIEVFGKVQGVGFRPAVYRLARKLGILGWVANSASGALLEIEGKQSTLILFLRKLKTESPRNSSITNLSAKEIASRNFRDFKILHSFDAKRISAEIPPDISICADCKKELFSSTDRRYLYPFINCTNCGPRFTIVKELPYDRKKTTMSSFKMCPSCRREYSDPLNRRFHAQPNACPVCGPKVELLSKDFRQIAKENNAVAKTVELLKNGNIIAVKSLGGYHLACDASNKKVLLELRKRKNRLDKPFALMLGDVDSVRKLCVVSKEEEKLLLSNMRPIALLRKRTSSRSDYFLIAPGNAYLGVMLPYTPLHYLLFSKKLSQKPLFALVMTSANRQDEPICRTENDAREKLKDIADYFLVNDRPIHNRCDDSIVQVPPANSAKLLMIRRSRGYVPESIKLFKNSTGLPNVFSAGAELKNTFCLTRSENAYVSQHIGDLDNDESISFYEEALYRLKTFLRVKPALIAHDLHPDYFSTRYAKEISVKTNTVPVQHHYAHIASVIAEKQLDKPVLGFAFDGNGYGTDGKIWGGECLLSIGAEFKRLAHFEYFPLPGGDTAVKEIWRIALSLLKQCGIREIPSHLKRGLPYEEIAEMIDKKINTPDCCSVGRIFDGISAIIGLRTNVTFEAQAAIELESMAIDALDNSLKKGYNFKINSSKTSSVREPLTISFKEIIRGILEDKKSGLTPQVISAKFHLTIAEIIYILAKKFRAVHKINSIALSGGVFQNRLLLGLAEQKLKSSGFDVYFNELVPANDGGISLGQAWVALKTVIRCS